jgi:hypothetical protein
MSIFNDNKDLYPTPVDVLEKMVKNEILVGKIIFDPSCGTGNILDFAKLQGAQEVLGCEIDERLRKIVQSKCKLIGSDFLKVRAEEVSHIDMIIMNPPFSADEDHILHAINIAPANCRILALCNWNTVNYRSYKGEGTQKQIELKRTINQYNGEISNLADCFSYAERKTAVDIGFIKLTKTGQTKDTEFDGFYMDEEPEDIQQSGLVKHNFVRETVNCYVSAVKKFEEVASAGSEIYRLTKGFFNGSFGFTCYNKQGNTQITLNKDDFKRELQKQAWTYIFNKLDMTEYVTQKLKEELNRFVEKQQQYPFTMKNVYNMIRIVILTHASRMDAALVESFDNVTKYHHENRYGLPGWKTNDVYLLGKKFVVPDMCPKEKYNDGNKISTLWGRNFDMIEDFVKGLCYITNSNYKKIINLDTFLRHEIIIEHNTGFEVFKDYEEARHGTATKKYQQLYEEGKYPVMHKQEKVYGGSYDWGFFKIKVYQKGTIHFEFKDENIWILFNKHIARIKGFVLPEQTKKGAKKEKEHAKEQKKVNEEMGEFTLTKKRNPTNPEPATTIEPEPVVQPTPATKPTDDDMLKRIKDLDANQVISDFEEEGKRVAQQRKEQEELAKEAVKAESEKPGTLQIRMPIKADLPMLELNFDLTI